METEFIRASFCLGTCCILLLGLGAIPRAEEAPAAKVVTFALCEDYDNGQDLEDIALDFQLLNKLGIDELRVSFGWDDYEPERGKYDFAWLHQFAELAAQHGIKLRPYICYAAYWAGSGVWNSPPNDYGDWYRFCYNLAKEMKRHPNIVSWELWNEEDLMGPDDWWSGTIDQYMELLRKGSLAIRAADPDKQLLLGGFARPRYAWIKDITQAGYGRYYDVVPVHCYVETWWRHQDAAVESAFDDWYDKQFLPQKNVGGSQPIWINEIGYSTLDRTEEQQANYLARAVAVFLSTAEIEYIGWYEIKDLDPGVTAIGDDHNHHLGITTFPDRKPKLAFHTLDVVSDLLNKKKVIPAADEVTIAVTSGEAGELYKYLFKISDGSQVLFVYDKKNTLTCDVSLPAPGKTCTKWNLDGTSQTWTDFDGTTISNVSLTPGQVWIFEISPE